MFADACEIAQQFTRPVVLSRRDQNGMCSAVIGAFVVVNKEGWAITASHIVDMAENLAQAAQNFQRTEAAKSAIYANTALDKKERGRQLKALSKFGPDAPINTSVWWSWDAARRRATTNMPIVDLAFIRLEPFDAAWVSKYPVFKDPAKPMQPGRSLCRLGFPFHSIQPVFDSSRNAFELPPGALPLPFFPLEGIHTRRVEVPHNLNPAPSFKLQFIETSSPGLQGQSGGPIFDKNGSIWGIQSKTVHFPLGFSPPVPNGKPNEKEHQFLNVGWGVHAETIVGAMRDCGINFAVSDD